MLWFVYKLNFIVFFILASVNILLVHDKHFFLIIEITPFVICGPLIHSSPSLFAGRDFPISTSITLHSVLDKQIPTEPCFHPFMGDINPAGLVSVIPQADEEKSGYKDYINIQYKNIHATWVLLIVLTV